MTKVIIPSFLAILLLSGCTQYTLVPKTSNAPSFNCNPSSIQRARFVAVNLSRVPLGGHKIQAVGTLGHPQKVESYMLQDSSMVEVMFYRTGEPGCYGMPTEDKFTPLVFQNGILIGYGNDYYRSFVLPSLKVQAAPTHLQGGYSYQQMQQAPQNNTGAAIGYGEPVWK